MATLVRSSWPSWPGRLSSRVAEWGRDGPQADGAVRRWPKEGETLGNGTEGNERDVHRGGYVMVRRRWPRSGGHLGQVGQAVCRVERLRGRRWAASRRRRAKMATLRGKVGEREWAVRPGKERKIGEPDASASVFEGEAAEVKCFSRDQPGSRPQRGQIHQARAQPWLCGVQKIVFPPQGGGTKAPPPDRDTLLYRTILAFS